MADPTTPRFQIPYPVGTDQVSSGPAEMQAIAQAVDTQMAGYASGTLAARPAAGMEGRFYRATNVGGANGTIYMDTGSVWVLVPSAATPVVARGYRLGGQGLATGTWVKVNLDTMSFDPLGSFDFVTNRRYVVPVAGYYQVNGQVLVGGLLTSGAYVGAAVYKNGVRTAEATPTPGNLTGTISANISDIISCVASDFLELWVFCNDTNAGLQVTSPRDNFLSVARIF